MNPDFNIVTAGDLQIMGAADPAQDLEAMLMAASGYNISGMGMNELDALDAQTATAGMAMAPALQQQVLANKIAAGAVVTTQSKPTRAREYPIGFLSAAPVAAGASVQVISQPQIVFRPERIVVPSDIAGQFSIDQVIVGKNNQFVASQPIPGRVFAENGVGVRLQMDTAQISQNIVLAVTNIGGAPATFRAAIIGPAVE
jgi:hypothetical protein